MTEQRHAASALESLTGIVRRTAADRERIAGMLGEFHKKHEAALRQLRAAVQENGQLKTRVTELTSTNERLTRRTRDLEQEVSMMASAIDVANREIADSDSMLLDAASAVRANFQADVAAAPASPQVKAPQTRPLAQAEAAAQARPAQDGPRLVVRPAVQAPSPAAAPVRQGLPVEVQDNLDKSLASLERMLNEGLADDAA